MKRLVETNLINGEYSVARKYAEMLRKTFCYRGWAEKMEDLMTDEKRIDAHSLYAWLRQIRLQEDWFPLEDYGLTYRLIPPGYEIGGPRIGIFQRNIHTFEQQPVLEESAVSGHCMNCHTSNQTDPSLFTLQIRGEGGGTLIQRDGVQTWLNTKTEVTKAAGSYAYWHPSDS